MIRRFLASNKNLQINKNIQLLTILTEIQKFIESDGNRQEMGRQVNKNSTRVHIFRHYHCLISFQTSSQIKNGCWLRIPDFTRKPIFKISW